MIWRPWRRQIQSETASLCHLSTHRIGKGRSDAVQDNGRDRNLDKSGGNPFISMEYLRGQTLKERLSEGGLSLQEALGIAGEIAEALAVGHHGISPT